jgi:adenylate cyclase
VEAEHAHTFLFADLAGYTALTEVHGDEQAAAVAGDFCAWARPLLPDFGAEEVKTIGDALLLRVDQPAEALRLAARMISDFGTRHGSLGVRVGMHTGTAVQRDGDWFGSAVNLAARVADAAQVGEALLTASTRDAVGETLPPGQLRSRGRRSLKHVREPVELFALVFDQDVLTPLPTDPVCLMAVDPERGHGPIRHEGVDYHFCSEGCALTFAQDPERYARRASVRDSRLVSDQARDRAVETLRRAYAKGRLTREELEERTEQAYAARTRADLRATTHGLPRPRRRLPWPARPFAWLFLLPMRLTRRVRRRRVASRRELRP